MTPYISVCDVFVNSGEESNTVALLTVLGHLYEKSTVPELFFTEIYLPDVTDTDVTEEYGCDADVGLLVAPPVPTIIPPLMTNLFWSQSKPSSGELEPELKAIPPLIVIVPLESIPSLFVAWLYM